jgi:hypothetical protein
MPLGSAIFIHLLDSWEIYASAYAAIDRVTLITFLSCMSRKAAKVGVRS